MRFLEKTHRLPNIALPKSIVEKFLWRKIFDHNPLFADVSDKLAAKSYAKRLCPDIEIPEVLWTGTDSREISNALLTSDYILKANHGCRFNAFLPDANHTPDALHLRTKNWLARKFGGDMGEWAYGQINPALFIEKMIIGDNGQAPIEYKIHACKGKATWGYRVEQSPGHPDILTIFDRNGTIHAPTPSPDGPAKNHGHDIGLPAGLIEMSETLSADFDAVRVDTYASGGKIHFGELTVYAASGYAQFGNAQLDQHWNQSWDLRNTWFLQTPQSGWKSDYAAALRQHLDRGPT